jgi:hypothetical protein
MHHPRILVVVAVAAISLPLAGCLFDPAAPGPTPGQSALELVLVWNHDGDQNLGLTVPGGDWLASMSREGAEQCSHSGEATGGPNSIETIDCEFVAGDYNAVVDGEAGDFELTLSVDGVVQSNFPISGTLSGDFDSQEFPFTL